MLINDISEDAASMLERSMTLAENFHADGVGVKDEDNVGPRG